MTENRTESVTKSRGRKKSVSASVVLDNNKTENNFSIETVTTNKIEKINLSDLYTLFKFAHDMCNMTSKEITLSLDNQTKESLKRKYYSYLDKQNKAKNELIKRMETMLND